MRLLPLISAVFVTGFLYMLVFEREALLAFAQTAPTEAVTPEVEVPANAVKVVVLRSAAQPIGDGVVLRGRTEAARQVVVRAETSGQVVSEPIRKGTRVAAGDLLCQIDRGTRDASLAEAEARLIEARGRLEEAIGRLAEAEGGKAEAAGRLQEARARRLEAEGGTPQAQASLAEAQARLREAQLTANNTKRLSDGGYASATQVANAEAGLEAATAAVERAQTSLLTAGAGIASADAGITSARAQITRAEAGVTSAQAGITGAEAGIESAEAAVAAARKELERLEIRAPFGGLLESDTAELGALLQPGADCATIIQLDPIKLVGFLPETDLSRISLGAPAAAELITGQELTGQVSFVSRSSDPDTRTFRVEVQVPNPDALVSDGLTADILVEAPGQNAHLVPQSALTLADNGDLGLRLVTADNTASFAPVHVLRDSVNGVFVSGLPDTADIIVAGQEYVTEGVPVAVQFKEASE